MEWIRDVWPLPLLGLCLRSLGIVLEGWPRNPSGLQVFCSDTRAPCKHTRLSIYIYLFIYRHWHIYLCVYIYIWIYTYTRTYTHIYDIWHMYVCIYLSEYISIYIHTYILVTPWCHGAVSMMIVKEDFSGSVTNTTVYCNIASSST